MNRPSPFAPATSLTFRPSAGSSSKSRTETPRASSGGSGDGLTVVFRKAPTDAVACADGLQRAVARLNLEAVEPLAIRVGQHAVRAGANVQRAALLAGGDFHLHQLLGA